MNSKQYIGFTSTFLCLLSACAVGKRHTADSKLEQNFMAHKTQFEALLAEVNADTRLEMVRGSVLRYAGHTLSGTINLAEIERLGFPKKRWALYQQQMKELGIVQITKMGREIEFRVDDGTLLNGDSYKGYQYSFGPPSGRITAYLDDYRIQKQDRNHFGSVCVYKPISDDWYLYLFVNGG